MSLLNTRQSKQSTVEFNIEPSVQSTTSSYVGAHPVLHYRHASTLKKHDHLEKYVETHPFEHTEGVADYLPTGLSDWWYDSKDKVVDKAGTVFEDMQKYGAAAGAAADDIYNKAKPIAEEYKVLLSEHLGRIIDILRKYGKVMAKNLVNLMQTAHLHLTQALESFKEIAKGLIDKVPEEYLTSINNVAEKIAATSEGMKAYMLDKAKYALIYTEDSRMEMKRNALKHYKDILVPIHAQIMKLGNKFKISPYLFDTPTAKAIDRLVKRFVNNGGKEDDAMLAITLGKLEESLNVEIEEIEDDFPKE